MYIKTLTVSAINSYMKKIIDNDFILNNTYVKGELSNFKVHSSGHAYFSIKDETSKLSCVMFKTHASNLKFLPKDGMKVIIKGKISVYQKDGTYQLYCEEIKPEGMGELYLAFQKLKERLENEGVFDIEHKQPLPKFPRKVGIVTSPTGAAVKDIINVAKRRNRNVNLLIYPALVQGINSAEDIIRGIEVLNSRDDIDIIILARGGGSIEELWSFNDERLAYAVFNSKKPIVTGVGHEIDYTIVDFVGDLRAPTPSAAAEIAIPRLDEMKERVVSNRSLLDDSIHFIIEDKFNAVDRLKRTLEYKSPENYIANQQKNISLLKERLNEKSLKRIESEKEKLSKYNALLNAHNPLNVLNKGYSIIRDTEGEIISSVGKLKAKNKITIRLKDGQVSANLSEIN